MTSNSILPFPLGDDRIEIIARDTAYQGYFRIDRYRLRHRKHDGGWTGEISREIFERGHAVGVLLYDSVRDEVALIEQFRAGAMAAGWEPWLYEVVAGIVEDGETAEDVARRESVEEAGCQVSDLVPICRYLASPGGTSESVETFCARIDTTNMGGLFGIAEEDEDIRLVVVPYADAQAMLTDGRAANSMLVICLQWLALNREALRQDWGVT